MFKNIKINKIVFSLIFSLIFSFNFVNAGIIPGSVQDNLTLTTNISPILTPSYSTPSGQGGICEASSESWSSVSCVDYSSSFPACATTVSGYCNGGSTAYSSSTSDYKSRVALYENSGYRILDNFRCQYCFSQYKHVEGTSNSIAVDCESSGTPGCSSGTASSCTLNDGERGLIDDTPPTGSITNGTSVFSTDNLNWCNIEFYIADGIDNYGSLLNPELDGCNYYRSRAHSTTSGNEDLLDDLEIKIEDPSGIYQITVELGICEGTWTLPDTISSVAGQTVGGSVNSDYKTIIINKDNFTGPISESGMANKFGKTRLDECLVDGRNYLKVTARDNSRSESNGSTRTTSPENQAVVIDTSNDIGYINIDVQGATVKVEGYKPDASGNTCNPDISGTKGDSDDWRNFSVTGKFFVSDGTGNCPTCNKTLEDLPSCGAGTWQETINLSNGDYIAVNRTSGEAKYVGISCGNSLSVTTTDYCIGSNTPPDTSTCPDPNNPACTTDSTTGNFCPCGYKMNVSEGRCEAETEVELICDGGGDAATEAVILSFQNHLKRCPQVIGLEFRKIEYANRGGPAIDLDISESDEAGNCDENCIDNLSEGFCEDGARYLTGTTICITDKILNNPYCENCSCGFKYDANYNACIKDTIVPLVCNYDEQSGLDSIGNYDPILGIFKGLIRRCAERGGLNYRKWEYEGLLSPGSSIEGDYNQLLIAIENSAEIVMNEFLGENNDVLEDGKIKNKDKLYEYLNKSLCGDDGSTYIVNSNYCKKPAESTKPNCSLNCPCGYEYDSDYNTCTKQINNLSYSTTVGFDGKGVAYSVDCGTESDQPRVYYYTDKIGRCPEAAGRLYRKNDLARRALDSTDDYEYIGSINNIHYTYADLEQMNAAMENSVKTIMENWSGVPFEKDVRASHILDWSSSWLCYEGGTYLPNTDLCMKQEGVVCPSIDVCTAGGIVPCTPSSTSDVSLCQVGESLIECELANISPYRYVGNASCYGTDKISMVTCETPTGTALNVSDCDGLPKPTIVRGGITYSTLEIDPDGTGPLQAGNYIVQENVCEVTAHNIWCGNMTDGTKKVLTKPATGAVHLTGCGNKQNATFYAPGTTVANTDSDIDSMTCYSQTNEFSSDDIQNVCPGAAYNLWCQKDSAGNTLGFTEALPGVKHQPGCGSDGNLYSPGTTIDVGGSSNTLTCHSQFTPFTEDDCASNYCDPGVTLNPGCIAR